MRFAYATSPLDRPSLVLNRSWIAIHVTTVRRALCLVYGGSAVIVDTETLQTFDFGAWCRWGRISDSNGFVTTPSRSIAAPEVIQLRHYNRVPSYDAPFTRRNLFERDGHACQYCGARHGTVRLSIDHVQPRSRGGRTSWDNCVLACVRCNSTKGDRTPRESGLRLLTEPRPPRWTPYLNLRRSERLASWAKFIRSTSAVGHPDEDHP